MTENTLNAYPLPWLDPLDLAASLKDDCLVLLYAGMKEPGGTQTTLLARGLRREVTADDWQPLAEVLTKGGSPYDNAWFGYLGYGLKNQLEDLPEDQPDFMDFPPLWFGQFEEIYRFCHLTQTLTCHSVKPPVLSPPAIRAAVQVRAATVTSPMTRDGYLAGVYRIIDEIGKGTLYQANLTRKFQGTLNEVPDSFALFCALAAASPAPFSAYIRKGERAILSSSMECFVQLSADGTAITRPIKGSAPRLSDPQDDARMCEILLKNPKERAENLMIVDLMRNDFARVCTPGSVCVDALYDVTSYATVHHLSSTVSGRKQQDVSALEFVQACFPPGSMTGAPKISAMKLASELEIYSRGVYSGALGWFGGDGSALLSVVIRTLLLDGSQFQFQVGGGIVSDSLPEMELKETLVKSRALRTILGIPEEKLALL